MPEVPMTKMDEAEWEKLMEGINKALLRQRIRRAVIGGVENIKRALHPIDTPPGLPAGSGHPAIFPTQLAPAMLPLDVFDDAKLQYLKGVNRFYQRGRERKRLNSGLGNTPNPKEGDYFG